MHERERQKAIYVCSFECVSAKRIVCASMCDYGRKGNIIVCALISVYFMYFKRILLFHFGVF